MKKYNFIFILALGLLGYAQQNLSEQMAVTVINTWKDSFAHGSKSIHWSYDMGVILKDFEGIWLHTGDATYYNYIQRLLDFYVKEDGTIKDYKTDKYNINHINNGKQLLLL